MPAGRSLPTPIPSARGGAAKTMPTVPPVYRPMPASAALQAKASSTPRLQMAANALPVVPPVFRPQKGPKTAQPKLAAAIPNRPSNRIVQRAAEMTIPATAPAVAAATAVAAVLPAVAAVIPAAAAAVASTAAPGLAVGGDACVITIAATEDTGAGGHAEIYVEFEFGGHMTQVRMDMIGGTNGRAVLRRSKFATGAMSNRGHQWVRGNGDMTVHNGGGSRSYVITKTQRDNAFEEFDRLANEAEQSRLKYTYYLPKLWSLNVFDGVKYMNCADFAAAILAAAGIGTASSGVLSMPYQAAS